MTPATSFAKALDKTSSRKKSRIILALDLDHRRNTKNLLRDAKKLVQETSAIICAVKINLHLLLPLSLSEMSSLNSFIKKEGLLAIADLKLNDIGNTNRVASEYLWDMGFSAVIVNPFVGYADALDLVFDQARKRGRGVITLAYMSHKGADEGYGLRLDSGKELFEEFLDRAKNWGADGVILGSTRPERIIAARNSLGVDAKIICPGSGAQGGDAAASIRAGADYLIYGRAITESTDPKNAAIQILNSLHLTAKS